MAKGRPEKSAALKSLAGNPGKRPIAEPGEAAPAAERARDTGIPRPPTWLDKIAARQWRLEYSGLVGRYLQQADLTGFAIYCAAVSRYRSAKEIIDRDGLTYTTGTGYVRERPEVKILEKAERTIRSFQDSLAANPLSRIRAGSIMASRQLALPLAPAGQGAGAPSATPKSPESPVGFAVH